jgi:hypothetical protein
MPGTWINSHSLSRLERPRLAAIAGRDHGRMALPISIVAIALAVLPMTVAATRAHDESKYQT